MPSFESAAELDKALSSGTYVEGKTEKYQPPEKKETFSMENLTPQQREDMRTSTMFIEVSQDFQAIASEAREAGMGAIAQRASARSGELYLKANEAGGMPEETRQAWETQLKNEVTNLRQSLATAKEAKEISAREGRTEESRAEVNDVLDTLDSEQAATSVDRQASERPVVDPSSQWETADPTQFINGKTIKNAFYDLAGDKKLSRNQKHQLKVIGKRYEQSFKELSGNNLSMKELVEGRNRLSQEAQKEWETQEVQLHA